MGDAAVRAGQSVDRNDGSTPTLLWLLRDPVAVPQVVVAPLRALVQRIGPHVDEVDPIIIGAEDQLDPQKLVAELVGLGYRREAQVEHRGEVAVRGSIVDVFPSTGDVPIRIDLWGDEVERLSTFTVNDQRSAIDLAEVEIFPCRELLATDDVRRRAAEPRRRAALGQGAVGSARRWPAFRWNGVVAALADRGRTSPV
ncbi:MAG: hypothetical protein R2706_11875 [Acidimicrobiales bacterium]